MDKKLKGVVVQAYRNAGLGSLADKIEKAKGMSDLVHVVKQMISRSGLRKALENAEPTSIADSDEREDRQDSDRES